MSRDLNRPVVKKGFYIALTGTDGAGKSTQAGMLAYALRNSGRHSYYGESKDDWTNEVLKSWVGSNQNSSLREALGNETMDILKALDVLRDESRIFMPMLLRGVDVIVPRSPACRLGLAHAYGSTQTERLESLLGLFGWPDLTIFLDVPTEVTMERLRKRAHDHESEVLMARFREGLQKTSARFDFPMVDASADPLTVHQRILAVVNEALDLRLGVDLGEGGSR